MASRGRGRRGHPQGTSQEPPVFDKKTFVEAIGIAAVAIVQVTGQKRECKMYAYVRKCTRRPK